MDKNKKKFSGGLVMFFLMLFALGGCATTNIGVSDLNNPPPKYKFSDFASFELKDVTISSEYAAHGANQKAMRKIQEVLKSRLNSPITAWNQKEKAAQGRTLVFEPKIVKVKFIGGGARFWAGPLAGSSAVQMEVVCKDKKTGNIIAQPQFYQQANAWSGSLTIGATDNMMLDRIANLIADYIVANYEASVGGPTGKSVS